MVMPGAFGGTADIEAATTLGACCFTANSNTWCLSKIRRASAPNLNKKNYP